MTEKEKITKGIMAVYKPVGISSFDVIKRLRALTGIRKIGHAGTLDPLAKGVLVVGIGKEACKFLAQNVKKEKEYLAVIKLGQESSTDDEEGIKKLIKVNKTPELKQIEKIIPQFEGIISQIPPIFSAKKVNGKRAYQLARKGENFTLKPSKVEVKKIELLKYKWPYLHIKVITGPGVYIRALARDIGKELCCGGYLNSLERTRVGEFTREKAQYIYEEKQD